MKPNAPKSSIWLIALILGILGIAAHFTHIQYATKYNYELLLVGFILLALGTTFRRI